ncbi:hypothetical protein BJ138DRAFT_74160 [Hygrophoropsis aurantiaca]|uniref:Uncharacterized protein n=1 Tax=Hygrophoropsis aurantiaca TaxID=72124 RepID=A0ACB7ZSJ5_9AGAM|nr:hypothetical protein BJ138DRAFT_74160 [Hygrophoropsis aurantiaca]
MSAQDGRSANFGQWLGLPTAGLSSLETPMARSLCGMSESVSVPHSKTPTHDIVYKVVPRYHNPDIAAVEPHSPAPHFQPLARLWNQLSYLHRWTHISPREHHDGGDRMQPTDPNSTSTPPENMQWQPPKSRRASTSQFQIASVSGWVQPNVRSDNRRGWGGLILGLYMRPLGTPQIPTSSRRLVSTRR